VGVQSGRWVQCQSAARLRWSISRSSSGVRRGLSISSQAVLKHSVEK